MKSSFALPSKISLLAVLFGSILIAFHSAFFLDFQHAVVIAVAFVMVVLWITESLPMAITALLPIIVFPVFQIASIEEICKPYADKVIMLFLGGFLIAIALEKCNLHTRLALFLLSKTASSLNGILASLMLSTYFLSMWISNTATALMMIPLAVSITKVIELELKKLSNTYSKDIEKFKTASILAIAYSANIGGIATVIGTPPNAVFKGLTERILNYEITFANWFLVGFPFSILLIIACYLVFTKVLFKTNAPISDKSKETFQLQLKQLGKFTTAQKSSLIVFILAATLWIFKDLFGFLFHFKAPDDTVISIFAGVLLFILPGESSKPVLEWKDAEKLPWGILILFGGGLTLAFSMQKTGLMDLLGKLISQFQFNSSFAILAILVLIMLFLTEILSNVALTTIFVPIVFIIASASNLNPIATGACVTIASSCAFMMPVGTPPNAIVYGTGLINLKQMIRAGIIINLISILFALFIAFPLANKLL